LISAGVKSGVALLEEQPKSSKRESSEKIRRLIFEVYEHHPLAAI
jgi:hypothetical protein